MHVLQILEIQSFMFLFADYWFIVPVILALLISWPRTILRLFLYTKYSSTAVILMWKIMMDANDWFLTSF